MKSLLETDPALTERLSARIEEGHYITDACALAGCSETFYYDTVSRGARFALLASKGHKLTASEQRDAEFAEAMRRAHASAKGRALRCLNRAIDGFDDDEGDWKAAVAFLERRWPREWGRYDRVEVGDHIATAEEEQVVNALIEDSEMNHAAHVILGRLSSLQAPDAGES